MSAKRPSGVDDFRKPDCDCTGFIPDASVTSSGLRRYSRVPLDPSIIETLKSVFAVRQPAEENKGGLYDLFERLVASGTENMLHQLKATGRTAFSSAKSAARKDLISCRR